MNLFKQVKKLNKELDTVRKKLNDQKALTEVWRERCEAKDRLIESINVQMQRIVNEHSALFNQRVWVDVQWREKKEEEELFNGIQGL